MLWYRDRLFYCRHPLRASFTSQVKRKRCHTGHGDCARSFSCITLVCSVARAWIGVCWRIPSVSHQETCPFYLATGGALATQPRDAVGKCQLSVSAADFTAQYNEHVHPVCISVYKFQNIVVYLIYCMLWQASMTKSHDLLLLSFIFITCGCSNLTCIQSRQLCDQNMHASREGYN